MVRKKRGFSSESSYLSSYKTKEEDDTKSEIEEIDITKTKIKKAHPVDTAEKELKSKIITAHVKELARSDLTIVRLGGKRKKYKFSSVTTKGIFSTSYNPETDTFLHVLEE